MTYKKITSAFLLIAISLIFFSCSKTNDDSDNVNIETIYLTDTIYMQDTIVVIDSIISIDTIVIYDTIIQEPNQFDYLFEHYELDTYKILFYTLDRQRSPYGIYTMQSNSTQITTISEGDELYPAWADEKDYIFYVKLSNHSIYKKYIGSDIQNEDELIYESNDNLMFLKYHEGLDMLLYSYSDFGSHSIAALNFKTGEINYLSSQSIDERNPTGSAMDEWIYYSKEVNGTFDIYRKTIDLSIDEPVYEDANFNLATFDVSYDGKFLVTPKYDNGHGILVYYDIENRKIIRETILPIQGHPLYASLSKDNRAIFLVNGLPYDYTKPRNIYRIGLDNTQQFKLTSFENVLASRPLVE